MTRCGAQSGWVGDCNSIIRIALRLEAGFARVNINDGMTEVMAWATGLMFLFFVTQLIHWLNQ